MYKKVAYDNFYNKQRYDHDERSDPMSGPVIIKCYINSSVSCAFTYLHPGVKV